MIKYFKSEKGAVAIIVALLIVVFALMAAMVVDVGSLYEDKRWLQTVADSAALAGAQELPEDPDGPDGAIAVAIEYANSNYAGTFDIDVTISSTLTNNDTIIVALVNPDAPLFFGKVTEGDTTTVHANATAIIASPKEVGGAMPWGVPEFDWVPGEEYVLKWGSGKKDDEGKDLPPSNFQALELDKTGGDEYRDNIVEGAEEVLIAGESVVPTETGNLVGPTEQGTLERIGGLTGLDSFESLTDGPLGGPYTLDVPGDGQFIWIIIIPELDFTGKKNVDVLGFAPFIITGIESTDKDSEFGHGIAITGTFLDSALIKTEGSIVAVETGGLRVIRLIE